MTLMLRLPADPPRPSRSRPLRFAVLASALLLLDLALPAPPAATAQEAADARAIAVTVETLDGRNIEARRLIDIGPKGAAVDIGGERKEFAFSELVTLRLATELDAARQAVSDDVVLDLWSGEEVNGRIDGGDGDGVDVVAPLLGTVRIALDHVAGMRFPSRLARVAEPPDLSGNGERDVIHLVGGDRMEGSLLSFSREGLEIEPVGGEASKVPYARITGLRLAHYTPDVPTGAAVDVILRDGSRITGVDAKLEKERLTLRSHSGFDATVRLPDVVEIHVRSDAFRYLSDITPDKIEVKPFWEMTAGSPEKLYAPRMDRSFAGSRLKCGGRNWTRGVGVFGGTSITWDLGGRYREFRAAVGIDDGAGDLGGVVFEVIVDGKTRWTSGFVRSSQGEGRGKPGPLRIDKIVLDGAKTLTLRVTTGDEDDPYPIQDEADWLGALLVK